MIMDHGIVRYKEPEMDRASFPEVMLEERGVTYFRDYQYRVYPGWVFVEYRCKVKDFTFDHHIYVRPEDIGRVDLLADHWSHSGYDYLVTKIHDTDPLVTGN